MSPLRVLDFGSVSPVMSLAIWHGIADAMTATDDPVLTLSNPDAPFICVGFHQDALGAERQQVFRAWTCTDEPDPAFRATCGR